MPRRTKKQTQVLAEPSEETPLWRLLQQVKEQVEAGVAEDDPEPEIHVDPEMQETLIQQDSVDTDSNEPEQTEHIEIIPICENNEIPVTTDDADGHTLTCYLSMIYAYCDLINKAMQQSLFISEQLITFMVKLSARYREEGEKYTAQEFKEALSICLSDDPDGLRGIRMEEEGIVFDGFSETEEYAYLESYRKFLQMLERASHTCRLTLSRNVHESEKFDMYQLLNKIHAGGIENRTMRKRMTERLSGHTAFADDAAKARWLKKHGKKKKAKNKRRK